MKKVEKTFFRDLWKVKSSNIFRFEPKNPLKTIIYEAKKYVIIFIFVDFSRAKPPKLVLSGNYVNFDGFAYEKYTNNKDKISFNFMDSLQLSF